MEKSKLTKMIDKAGKLDREIKSMTEELKVLKEGIVVEAGFDGNPQKIQGKSFLLSITKIVTYTEINPKVLSTYLTKVGKVKFFHDVIKVQIAALKDLIGENDMNKLRSIEKESPKLSFKEIVKEIA